MRWKDRLNSVRGHGGEGRSCLIHGQAFRPVSLVQLKNYLAVNWFVRTWNGSQGTLDSTGLVLVLVAAIPPVGQDCIEFLGVHRREQITLAAHNRPQARAVQGEWFRGGGLLAEEEFDAKDRILMQDILVLYSLQWTKYEPTQKHNPRVLHRPTDGLVLKPPL